MEGNVLWYKRHAFGMEQGNVSGEYDLPFAYLSETPLKAAVSQLVTL